MIKIKRGATLTGCRSPILLALILIAPIFSRYGIDLVVTEGPATIKHTAHRSAHYRGDAVDIRSRTIKPPDRQLIARRIRAKLSPDYVVIVEKDHFHIHWSPIYHELS